MIYLNNTGAERHTLKLEVMCIMRINLHTPELALPDYDTKELSHTAPRRTQTPVLRHNLTPLRSSSLAKRLIVAPGSSRLALFLPVVAG